MTTMTSLDLAVSLRRALKAAGINPDTAPAILDDPDRMAATLAPDLAETLSDPRTRRSVWGMLNSSRYEIHDAPWIAAGYTTAQAAAWRKLTPDTPLRLARRWRAAGLAEAADAAPWIAAGITPEDAAEWLSLGCDLAQALAWIAVNAWPRLAAPWIALGITHPGAAATWYWATRRAWGQGLTDEDAAAWYAAGIIWPLAALVWRKAHYTPAAAGLCVSAGILWPSREAHRLACHLVDQVRAYDQARRRAARAERASAKARAAAPAPDDDDGMPF